jgi:tRNA(Leu) C34 or U34 (ribose-2'-O)-methylase TrmL
MGTTHMANIAVVLVEPQIPENIGAAARAMNNMGFRLYDHLNFHTNYHKPFDLK